MPNHMYREWIAGISGSQTERAHDGSRLDFTNYNDNLSFKPQDVDCLEVVTVRPRVNISSAQRFPH